MRYLLAWALVLALTLPSCSLADGGRGGTLEAGDTLDTTDITSGLPSSRAAYASLATYVSTGVIVFRPGTGPDDPPQLLRTYGFPGHLVSDAQIDRDGYLWVATADRPNAGGSLRVAYVVDPHTGTVVRTIDLPQDLRSTTGLIVGPEQVYLYAQRNGFSAAIGTVDRRCATDKSACEASVFAELGPVGSSSGTGAFRLLGGDLYSFSMSNSADKIEATNRFDRRSGDLVATAPFGGAPAVDAESIFLIGPYGTERGSYIVRLDRETLVETGRVFDRTGTLLDAADGRLYVGGFRDKTIRVYDTETLELLDTIDTSEVFNVTYAFGFAAPDVLMLGGAWWVNTRTNEVNRIENSTESQSNQALRLPEGHPLAH